MRGVNVTSGDSVGRWDVSVGGEFWRGTGKGTYGIITAEAETQTECLVQVDGVGVEDLDVHLPFFEVVGGDEGYAWWEGLVDLAAEVSVERKRMLGGLFG